MKKRKKEEQILVIQKYKGSMKGIITMGIALAISICCYVLMLYLAQLDDIADSDKVIILMLRDVLLAIVSIIATSLLTSVFIEKNKKNVDYTELIANDIFASKEFYANLSAENKTKMLKYLSQEYQEKDPVRNDIQELCRKRLFETEVPYYYESFDESTSYRDYGSYTEKKSVRILKLRSYSEPVKLKSIRLLSYKLSETNGVKTFELLEGSFGSDNSILEIGKDITVENKETRSPLLRKNGYVHNYIVTFCKELTLLPNEDTIISFTYVSRVSDGDMSSGVGVSVPCRNFSINFHAPEGYVVHAHSNGFLDSGENASNPDFPNEISVKFHEWVLPGEGVVFCVTQPEQQTERTEAAVTQERL